MDDMGIKRGRETNWDSAARNWKQQKAWRLWYAGTGSPGKRALICSTGQLEASNSLNSSLQNSKMFNNLLL